MHARSRFTHKQTVTRLIPAEKTLDQTLKRSFSVSSSAPLIRLASPSCEPKEKVNYYSINAYGWDTRCVQPADSRL